MALNHLHSSSCSIISNSFKLHHPEGECICWARLSTAQILEFVACRETLNLSEVAAVADAQAGPGHFFITIQFHYRHVWLIHFAASLVPATGACI